MLVRPITMKPMRRSRATAGASARATGASVPRILEADLPIPPEVRRDAAEVSVRVEPSEDGSRVTVIAADRVGMLADTAAALALHAAERGRRVVVLTVDPSRRLAQALGLGAGSAEPREVPEVAPGSGGSLHAAVLDARATLDALVDAALEPQQATGPQPVLERLAGPPGGGR